MTQTKHTAGPWKALEFDRIYADSKFVALVYPCTEAGHSTPESTANARLIAAAPDMLEALRKCRSPISGYAVKDAAQASEVLSHFLDHIRKVDAIASAAIAKATGVQP